MRRATISSAVSINCDKSKDFNVNIKKSKFIRIVEEAAVENEPEEHVELFRDVSRIFVPEQRLATKAKRGKGFVRREPMISSVFVGRQMRKFFIFGLN